MKKRIMGEISLKFQKKKNALKKHISFTFITKCAIKYFLKK